MLLWQWQSFLQKILSFKFARPQLNPWVPFASCLRYIWHTFLHGSCTDTRCWSCHDNRSLQLHHGWIRSSMMFVDDCSVDHGCITCSLLRPAIWNTTLLGNSIYQEARTWHSCNCNSLILTRRSLNRFVGFVGNSVYSAVAILQLLWNLIKGLPNHMW